MRRTRLWAYDEMYVYIVCNEIGMDCNFSKCVCVCVCEREREGGRSKMVRGSDTYKKAGNTPGIN